MELFNFRLQADTEKPEESRCVMSNSTTMKELNLNQMEEVKGGFTAFWRSACAVWAGISYFKLITYLNPVTAALGKAVDVTCIIVGIEAAAEALID